jgi:hypothetical protein
MEANLKNQWLIQNNRSFQALKRQLMEYQYKGLNDLPSRTIQAMLESAIIEISKLQRELDEATSKLKAFESNKSAKGKK